MPLGTRLKNGDMVEIIRSPKQGPSAVWEKMVVTGRAQASIRKYLRNAERLEQQRMGRAIIEKAFGDAGHEYSDKAITVALPKLNLARTEDVFQSLANGEISPVDVLTAAVPTYVPDTTMRGFERLVSRKSKPGSIPIQSMQPGLAFHLARCCQPLAGDRIIGVITQGSGVMVHTADCERLADVQEQPDRWVDVRWAPDAANEVQVGRLRISINNVSGTLAKACEIIARQGGNITNLKIANRTPLVFDMLVDIEVNDTRHLASITAALRASPAVHAVDRPHGEQEDNDDDA
jgi:GTP pyrophosphokinase